MTKIGRRISIYGPTGSGKSTLARELARRTGLPHIELDAIFWLPGWTEKPLEEFCTDVTSALEGHRDGWICTGNYGRIRNLVLSRADTVIWLRLPFRVTFWRVLKRTISRCIDRKPLWEDNTNFETVRQAFFSRDSLILYAWKNRNSYHQRIGDRLKEAPGHVRIVRLDSPDEVKRFLEELED